MIEVTNLKKSFRNKNIIENISFRVERGEQLAILGRNGCGKSTLIKILAGIQKPDGGEITYFNQNPLAAPKLFRTYCGYVPQENPLIYELSVQDNLSLWSGKRGKQNEEIIRWFELDELLKEVYMNLTDDCITGLVIMRLAVSLIVEVLILFCTYRLAFDT